MDLIQKIKEYLNWETGIPLNAYDVNTIISLLKEVSMDFTKYVNDNYYLKKGRYMHKGDFYKNGKSITLEQIWNEFVKEYKQIKLERILQK